MHQLCTDARTPTADGAKNGDMHRRNGNAPGQRDDQTGQRNTRDFTALPAHPGNPFYLLFRARRRTIRTMINATATTAATT